MSGYLFAVVLCVILIALLIQLLRKRRIREKYAGIWIVVAVGVVILGAFPHLAVKVARLVGVQLPVNLVFAIALVVLLFVCVQLSVGVSNLDERVRTLTEEVALLRIRLDDEPEDQDGAAPDNAAPSGEVTSRDATPKAPPQ